MPPKLALISLLSTLPLALPAAAQASGETLTGVEVTVLLREGQPVPGFPGGVLDHIGQVDVNTVGGYTARLRIETPTEDLSAVFGSPDAATPGSVLAAQQAGTGQFTVWGLRCGISDSGEVLHGSFDSQGPGPTLAKIIVDDTVVVATGDPISGMVDKVFGEVSTKGLLSDGRAYWTGEIRNFWTGGLDSRTVFLDGVPVVQQHDLLPNVPNPLGMNPIDSNLLRFSPDGSHYIAVVAPWSGPVAVIDGVGLMLGGQLVARGVPVASSIGGLPGEEWRSFYNYSGNDSLGITNEGSYVFYAELEDSVTGERRDVLVKDGQIVLRQGSVLANGSTIQGVSQLALSPDGRLASVVNITSPSGFAGRSLLVNGHEVLRTGTAVDLDGDGSVDPGATISAFETNNFFSGSTYHHCAAANDGTIYLPAHVDSQGTTTTTDDIEVLLAVRPAPLSAPPTASHSDLAGIPLTLLAQGADLGDLYLLLGSLSGSSPGLSIDGVLLPLVLDAYTTFTFLQPNSAALQNGFGEFDALGAATATFVPGVGPASLIGSSATHAFLTLSVLPAPWVRFASNPVETLIAP